MNYCFNGKQPNPADLLPRFPKSSSLSATLSKAVEGNCSKNTLQSQRPSAIQCAQPTSFQMFKEGCERHYKCIENILRRIAANIGNTPSQTDVKIVSCIPIDVTDLQQRIFNLERQLEEAKMTHNDTGKVCRKTFFASTSRPSVGPGPMTAMRSSVEKRSACDICRSVTNPDNPCKCWRKQMRPQLITGDLKDEVKKNKNLDMMLRPELQSSEKPKLGKSTIKIRSKPRQKPEALVYYVQTNTIPFDSKSPISKTRSQAQDPTSKRNRSVTNIEDSIQKKYASQLLADFSSSSEYSAPVCHDAVECSAPPPSRETDVFSCNGKFHNLDYDIKNLRNDAHSSSCSKFYDDSLYDLVPVKEKSRDVRKNSLTRKKREQFDTHMHYLGPNNRTTYKIPEETDFVMNYAFDSSGFPTYHNFRKMECPKHPKSLNGIKKYLKKQKVPENKDTLRKNVSCFTVKMINTECQTTSDENSQSNTTTLMSETAENTLYEIKETLQTVLETVKTNSRLKSNTEKPDDNKIQTTKSEIMEQNLKYMASPHGASGPIQLFYTPVPFISPSFITPCRHIQRNVCNPIESTHEKQNEDIQKPQNDNNNSQEQVTDIWKHETEDGRAPIFISTTSERDESSLKKEDVKISVDQPQYVTKKPEGIPEINSHNPKPYEEEMNKKCFIDEDRLSMVEETTTSSEDCNESGVEAEDEEEENEYEYAYGDVSEAASVSVINEEYIEEDTGNENEKISGVSYESLEARESIVQPQKEKKLDKMFHKVLTFFKNKPSKSDKLSSKESKRLYKKFGDKCRNRQLSKTCVKFNKKRKSSSVIELNE